MNQIIENILTIMNDKKMESNIKTSIFNIIKEEMNKTELSKEDILKIKEIFHEPSFSNFYVSKYPDLFIDNKDDLINSMAEITINGIIEKLPLLLNYNDDISYHDFKKLMSIRINTSFKSDDDKKEEFYNFCWNNLFKKDFCFDDKFGENLKSTSYDGGISSKILTPIILEHKKEYPFNKLCSYEEKNTLPFYQCFIISQMIYTIYPYSYCEENLNIIREHYKDDPEEFNQILMTLLMNRRKDLSEKKKHTLSIRKILLGNIKDTLIRGIPYFNFESFLNEDMKKSIGAKSFENFINKNTFSSIVPFVMGNPKTNSVKEILDNYVMEENLLKTLVEFSEKQPEIALYTYNQGINEFSGGAISRIIKAIGEKKGLSWDNIFENSEHVHEVLFSFTDTEEFNKNLFKLRENKHYSLFNEIALYSLYNDIPLDKTNLTYVMVDFFQNNISSNMYKKIKTNYLDLLEKHGDKIDYNIAIGYTWDEKNIKEKSFVAQIEKNKIFEDLKAKLNDEKNNLLKDMNNDIEPVKRKRI